MLYKFRVIQSYHKYVLYKHSRRLFSIYNNIYTIISIKFHTNVKFEKVSINTKKCPSNVNKFTNNVKLPLLTELKYSKYLSN